MEFFEAVGFGLVLLAAFAGFFVCVVWSVFTKRPGMLFIGLLGAGIFFPAVFGATDPSLMIAVTLIFGAIGAGIFGSINAASTGKKTKVRLLLGSSMITLAIMCFVLLFGMISFVPGNPIVLEILTWSIVAPVGLMGLFELRWDFFGVGITFPVPAK